MTIHQAFQRLTQQLKTIYDVREATTIAQYLFEDAFQIRNTLIETPFLYTAQLETFIPRLLKHEPWQYVIGQADFYNLKFKVDSSVLIPRPETEELVYWINQNHKNKGSLSILDIGTGSGCIPITLKHLMPTASITAVDVSETALSIAQQNAEQIGVEVTFKKVDILKREDWSKLPNFDIIVSNPPYIPLKEKNLMRNNVLRFEPDLALFVEDKSPLLFYEVISDFALEKLSSRGYLYFEINEFLGQALVQLLQRKGFKSIELEQDMSGRDRMIRAIKP